MKLSQFQYFYIIVADSCCSVGPSFIWSLWQQLASVETVLQGVEMQRLFVFLKDT